MVLLAFMGQGAAAATTQGIPVVYVFIQEEFSLTRTQVGLITSAIFGAGASTSLLMGWALDRYGIRRVLPLGLFLLSGGFLLFSQGHSLGQLFTLGVLLGMVTTVGHPAGSKAIMDWLPLRVRAIGMSLKQAAVPAIGAVSAAVLPAIAVALGWRMAIVVLALVVLVAALTIFLLYRDNPLARGLSAGRGTFTQGLGAVVRNRGLLSASVMFILMVGLQFVLLTYLIIFLTEVIRFPVLLAGAALAVVQVTSFIGRIVWGAVSDGPFRGRRIPVLLIVNGLSTLFLLAMAALTSSTPTWIVWALIVALGLTVISWHGVYTAMVAELAGPGLTGTAIGFIGTFSRLGPVTIPPLFGFIVDSTDGNYRLAWLGAALLAAVATLSLTLVREVRREG
ncbi:MAG: MFS transporter [Dehalococcoidia bacterium]